MTTLAPSAGNHAVTDLEIIDVRLIGPPPARVRDHYLDARRAGRTASPQVIHLSGWVLPSTMPINGVATFCQGSLLRATPLNISRPDVAERFPDAGTCGFTIALSLLELPPEFEITLQAVFADQERHSAGHHQRPACLEGCAMHRAPAADVDLAGAHRHDAPHELAGAPSADRRRSHLPL